MRWSVPIATERVRAFSSAILTCVKRGASWSSSPYLAFHAAITSAYTRITRSAAAATVALPVELTKKAVAESQWPW